MIYLVEDDDSIRELVCYALEKTGEGAVGFSLPSEFYTALEKSTPDLVLLDIMLPEEDGLCILSRLRSDNRWRSLPVIMLTAKGSEFDKVRGLDLGADDYITKPFGVMELVARVKAVIRRTRRSEMKDGGEYAKGGVCLCVRRREVTAGGRAVELTYKEFELLKFLFENAGTVLSRDRILNEVWGYGFGGESRTVDVHVRTLRQKLGDFADIIETVRGVGYRIAE
ncbi:MAG: response regulator transcription factor [Clostridia bacterium]|nr:response regulator transcription factor [Clostridia bacterium]